MKKLLTIFSILLSFGGFGQSLTEVLYPLYIQGVGSGNVTDDRKVPFACRMTASGLTPNTTYRYYNRFVTNPADQDNGQGNYIIVNQTGDFIRVTAASLAVAGRYGEFTTDGGGSYTGWFVVEPSIATTHYQPGTQIYFRLLLNNGAGGGAVVTRLTATNPVTVLGFGSAPGQGTGIYNTANAALNAKNFVMLYNNIGGTGRPVAGTFIESDGTVNDATTSYYAPFYANSVDANDKVWGTIIPNNLASGVNNISQYSLSTGAIVNACTSPNGVYGAANTANASGGLTPLVVTCTPASTCNISLSTAVTNVACAGQPSGAINLTVAGATAPVTYNWSNGATTEDLTFIPAGTYTVTVTDANNCTTTTSVIISEPLAGLSASATSTPVTTTGGSDGTATANVNGGTPPYSYLWTPGGQTTATAIGLIAVEYIVTVTDANGCSTFATAVVGSPTCNVTLTFAQTNVSCFGGSNGTATVTAAGTSGTVSYAWSNGQTTATATGLAAGLYTVTVTDEAGCTASGSVTITQPPVLAASATSTPVTTAGGSDGTATATVNGGTPPYTYLWSPGGQTTAIATGLISALYTVTVTDANGCVTTATTTVGSPSCNIVLSFAQTDVSCFGGSNGTATVTATGANGTVSYAWSNGQTTATATGLAAGLYTVTVTDGAGCTSSGSVTITQPPVLAASATSTPVTTTGGSDGTATATVNGGTPSYTYLWSPGGQTTAIATGLISALYTVTVADANGCVTTATTTVGSPSCNIVLSFAQTDVSCFGSSNGTATVTAAGTSGDVSYFWSNGQTTATATGLAAGLYTVTVTDGAGCTSSGSVTITQPPVIAASAASTPVTTTGGSDGTATATVNGGTQPYTYLWSPGGQTTATATGLMAALYTITVTDANGCTTTATTTVGSPSCNVVLSFAQTNVSCFGGSDGTATVTAAGASGTVSYAWSNGQTTATATGLAAGLYTVTVTDESGCTSSGSVTITQPPVISASATSTPVTTTGGSDGTATVSVNGGTPPYLYVWNPGGQTTATATGLTTGFYTVTITDANGCIASATATIGSASCNIITSIAATGLSCIGTTDNGALDLTVNGGTSPYTYLWSNGATTEDISGLAPGAYLVTVTDASGCTVNAGATVAARLLVTSLVTPPACGATSTTVTVSASGGTLPYSGTGTFTVNTGTQYTFTVTDAAGCVRTVTGNIANPLVASSSAGTILCGATSTTVTVTASAGTPPYTGTGTFTVGAGAYSFQVTDARGCVAIAAGVVEEPSCKVITEVYYPKFIQGVGSGNPADDRKVPYAARMTVSGLNPVTTYRYFNRFVNDTAAGGNGQGNYIIVNQSGNFTRVTSASLAAAGRYGEFTTDATGSFTGWFIAEPTIATDHYQPGTQLYFRLMLNDGAGGGSVESRVTSRIPVTVLGFGSTPTDGTGIRAAATSALSPKNFIMLYDNLNGTQRPVAGTFIESDGTDNNATTSGYAPFYATKVDGVANTWGSIIPNNLSAGINNISQYALSDGSFINKCTSANGTYDTTATANASGGLSELVISCSPVGVADSCTLMVSIAASNVSCFTGNNGKADLTVKGGTGPFVYSWSNGSTTEDLAGIPAGIYYVSVKDTKGCEVKDSVKVTQPTELTGYPELKKPVSCYNGSDAVVVIYAEGGTAPYKYTIGNQTNTTSIFTGLSAGHYTGYVTDANGCTIEGSGDIEEPKPIVINAKATGNNLIGYGSTYVLFLLSDYQRIKLDASAYGGEGHFTYDWGEAGKTATVHVSPKKTTIYKVVATDKNGCSKTTSLIIYVIDLRCCGSNLSESPLISEVSPNGTISENNITVFKLYPNPASSYVTIESPITRMLEKSKLSVFDMKGRLVINRQMNKANLNRIDVSALQQGMYLVQLKSSGRIIISGKISIVR